MDQFYDIFRGLIGLVSMLGICYAFSSNKKAIDWKTVGIGMGIQLVIALLILKVPFVSDLFDILARGFEKTMSFSKAGAEFIFGDLVTKSETFGYIFAFQVLPTIIFFSALSALLYYYGILQKIVYALAWAMNKTLKVSGAESLASAANIFLGQTEAPLIIKPYVKNMTKSEILCLMVGGMANIAGGVFAAYVGFLGGDDPELRMYFAKHLLTASVMSAPAAIVCSKILLPETEKVLNSEMYLIKDESDNVLDALSKGITDGLMLAVNVGVMLMAFTALVALFNALLMKIVSPTGLNEFVRASTNNAFQGFNFTYILGLIFAPISWLIGTPAEDILISGQLLGQKTVLNEFVAYAELNKIKASGIPLHPKTILIATYALCGFANFASIGIQIGGIGALAPEKRVLLTQLGVKALIGGTISTFLTASIAGMFWR
jgi:concentrative nucleoside transporter, CNT family